MLRNSIFIVKNKIKFECEIRGKRDFVGWNVGIKEQKGTGRNGNGTMGNSDSGRQARKKMAIITAYRVVQEKVDNAGVKTSVAQQYAMLREMGETNPNPRKQFMTDLKKYIRSLQDQMEIVLVMDAYEQWERKLSKIKEFAMELGLINVGKTLHDDLPPTFPASKRTLDFMLASEGVMPCVEVMGMVPYIKQSLGDHRGMYVDLNARKLLGLDGVDEETSITRRLQYSDVKKVKKYVEVLEAKLKDHKVFERMESLVEKMKKQKGMMNLDEVVYEQLDRDVFLLEKCAEKKCTRVSYRRYAWSPTLDRAIKRVRLWSRVVDHGWTSPCKVIQGLAKELEVGTKPITKQQQQERLKEAEKELQEVQKNSAEIRVEFLNELAARYAIENNISEEIAVRELLAHEELKEIFKEVRYGLTEYRQGQTYRIWLPNDNNPRSLPPSNWKVINSPSVEVTDSEEMNKKLVERNTHHLQQAKATPFADCELGKRLG